MTYDKDKGHRITLRLNDEQFAFVANSAKVVDISPSEFLRQVIAFTMAASKHIPERSDQRRENEQDGQHDLVEH